MSATIILGIKEAVRNRDGRACLECGMTEADHIERFGRTLDVHRKIPGSEYSVDGGESLCIKCHMKRHGRKLHVTKMLRRQRSEHAKGLVFSFKCSQSLREQIKMAASAIGISPTQYVRMVAIERMQADGIQKPPKKKPRED